MELKKRKKSRDFSVDEMLILANQDFVKNGRSSGNKEGIFTLSITCFEDSKKRYVVSDTREENCDYEDIDMLPAFYGETSKEALKKAIDFRLGIIDG